MSVKAHLAELERRHQELEEDVAGALSHRSSDDLKITELKRQRLHLKDEIERLRHEHAM